MNSVRQQLHDLNDELAHGKIDVDEWADAFDAALLQGHHEALVLGSRLAGAEPDEKALLIKARGIKDTESEFLQGFVDAIHAKDPRYVDEHGHVIDGSLNARTNLYVGRMRGSANEQFAKDSGDEEIDWVETGAEHCEDCPVLAAGSPYTKDSLPSYPGDGGTECLGNCTCVLERRDGVRGFAHVRPEGGEEEDQPELPLDLESEAKDLPGFSLSDSVKSSRPVKALVDSVMAEIDGLARFAEAKPDTIGIGAKNLDAGTLGLFQPKGDDKGQITVDLTQNPNEHRMTLVHELGHAIDLLMLGGKVTKRSNFNSRAAALKGTGPLVRWWKSVKGSKKFKELEALVADDNLSFFARHMIAGYYLDPTELFARSFTQFIGSNAEGRTIKKEWSVASKSTIGGLTAEHWTDEDFGQIDAEFRALFKELGKSADDRETEEGS